MGRGPFVSDQPISDDIVFSVPNVVEIFVLIPSEDFCSEMKILEDLYFLLFRY